MKLLEKIFKKKNKENGVKIDDTLSINTDNTNVINPIKEREKKGNSISNYNYRQGKAVIIIGESTKSCFKEFGESDKTKETLASLIKKINNQKISC